MARTDCKTRQVKKLAFDTLKYRKLNKRIMQHKPTWTGRPSNFSTKTEHLVKKSVRPAGESAI
jgi:hypothetical protein